MRVSDWINVILCILSFALAAISVVTVVITLKQNCKMIKNSTRPYVVAMAQVTNFQEPTFYLLIKNFGNSGAVIDNFKCSIDLSIVSYRDDLNPFKSINGSFIAPGQSYMCCLYSKRFEEKAIREFVIEIDYSAGKDKYHEVYPISHAALIENINTRAAAEGKELRIISYALQDLVEKSF